MNIQDLEPYLDRVVLFLKGDGVPNEVILKEIRTIYDATIKDKRLPQTSLGCGNCITRMFNQIQGAANRGEIVAKGKRMKFPKVEQIVTLAGHFGHNNQIDLEEQIAEEQTKAPIDSLEIPTDMDIIDYSKMAWGELRKHAASKGIKVKGLRRGNIISKLKEL